MLAGYASYLVGHGARAEGMPDPVTGRLSKFTLTPNLMPIATEDARRRKNLIVGRDRCITVNYAFLADARVT